MTGRLYLDASALVKLVLEEPESAALGVTVDLVPELTSSAVAWAEVRLAAARSGIEGAEQTADQLLDTVVPMWLTDDLLRRAGRLRELRALDAIHLASALSLEASIEGFVVYDQRLGDAAARAGLAVMAPA